MRGGNERPDWRALPRPQVDTDDAAAGYLATISAADPQQMIADLHAAPERTVEVELRHAAALIELGDWDRRGGAGRGRGDRSLGMAGRVVSRRSRARARARVPRPHKLRDGLSARFRASSRPSSRWGWPASGAGETVEAAGWYEIVSRTDPAFTAATSAWRAAGSRPASATGALAAYDRVPDSSSAYVEAQTARIPHASPDGNGAGAAAADELLAAGAILESLPVRGEQRVRLQAEVLEAALALVERRGAFDDGRASLLGYRFLERDLRLGVERSYRELARWAGIELGTDRAGRSRQPSSTKDVDMSIKETT